MPDRSEIRLGFVASLSCFLMWGVMPLYFIILKAVPSDVLLAHRILWSLPTGLLLLLMAGRLGRLIEVFKSPRVLAWLGASGLLIGLNWLIYIWAVHQERVLEASLGYYINPLLSFLLGAILFGERFNRLQVGAMLLALLGVLNQWLVVGVFPWVALVLCLTFGIYSVIRKKIQIDSRVGFTLEVLLLTPMSLIYLGYMWRMGEPLFPPSAFEIILLLLSGIITAAPLILFAVAAKRLNLSTIGLMQFLGPTLQFIIGLYFGETFTSAHAITFVLIWSGVGMFSYALWRREHRSRVVQAA